MSILKDFSSPLLTVADIFDKKNFFVTV